MIDWDALAAVTEGFMTDLLGWVFVADPETDSGDDSDWECLLEGTGEGGSL